jgi:predicted PurR-regulated permease PerM
VIGEELGNYWSDIAADRKRWIEQLDKEVESPIKSKATADDDDIKVTPHTELLPGYAEQIQSESADKTTAKPDSESSPIIAMLGRFLAWARTGLIAVGLTVGQGVTQILISTFLAFFLLRDSPQLAARLNVSVERLAGDRGRQLIKVAGNTVSGVIYGILGTAIAQAIVAGIGFTIAGIPGAVLLSVLTFFFAVIPFGPPLIWLPATIWLFANEKHGLSLFMLLWGIFVISSVDNLLRPYLISQGTKLPFALIFCGVIGGALAFGLVGVFLGPTLLAVAFRLTEEWSSEKPAIASESPAASI